MQVAQYQASVLFAAALLLGLLLKGKNDVSHMAAFALMAAFVSAYAGSIACAWELSEQANKAATYVGLVALALAVVLASNAVWLFVT